MKPSQVRKRSAVIKNQFEKWHVEYIKLQGICKHPNPYTHEVMGLDINYHVTEYYCADCDKNWEVVEGL